MTKPLLKKTVRPLNTKQTAKASPTKEQTGEWTKKKILFVTSEFSGLAQTGGLGQISRELPMAMKKKGHDVRVVMPFYKQMIQQKATQILPSLHMRPGFYEFGCAVFETKIDDLTVYLIEHDRYFNRPRLYDDGQQEYSDNPERFCLLAAAALEICDNIDFYPDVVHCNDWQTALLPLYVKRKKAANRKFASTACLLTVHNGLFQGQYAASYQTFLGLYESFNADLYEEYSAINLLKGGIGLADWVNTVSTGYAQELLTVEGGHGLTAFYQRKGERFSGILNGCDYSVWNPQTDPYLKQNYTLETIARKLTCKIDVLQHFGLDPQQNIPLIGMVGRITAQKGFEYTIAALEGLLKHPDPLHIIVLGDGEERIVRQLNLLKVKYPQRFSFYCGYREDLSHKIEAGADLFLMPSLFEPCGLNQLYSLKYGTPPIVRHVGGLKDTVKNYDPKQPHTSTGFVFHWPTSDAVYHTVRWAVDLYQNNPNHFYAMIKAGMSQNFSWEQSCINYEELYQKIKQ